MLRGDCLRILAPLVTDELVVVGMTGVNWEWRSRSHHEGNIFIGSMGHAAAVATGMALAVPHRRVIAFESDGSTLLDLPALTTMAMYRPDNLKVFVFDNEVYSGSRISEPSATARGADLELIARGAGIEGAATVRDLDAFRAEAEAAVSEPGLRYVVAKVEEDLSVRRLPKPRMDYLENMYRFVRYVERTEGREILPELR
jgi:sulfopyruvate decarboxylase subunit beta